MEIYSRIEASARWYIEIYLDCELSKLCYDKVINDVWRGIHSEVRRGFQHHVEAEIKKKVRT